MWAFDWFASYFSQTASLCSDIASRARAIPVLGTYFAYPFDSLYYVFANLRTAAQYASSWADGIVSTASAAWQKALDGYNYAYGWLTSAVNNTLNIANSAWDYARNTVWNLANTAWLKAQDAYNYTSGWISTTWNTFVSTFWSQINAILSWKNGFISDFWNQINAINTWKNDILSKIPTPLLVVDWIEASLGYLTTKAITLITNNAASFANPLWQCIDAIVGKLTEYKE